MEKTKQMSVRGERTLVSGDNRKTTTPVSPEVENKPIIYMSHYYIKQPMDQSDDGTLIVKFSFIQNHPDPINYSSFLYELEKFIESKYR